MLLIAGLAAAADPVRIAAASDLKFAMDEIVASYRQSHADAAIEVIYGSSGNFKPRFSRVRPSTSTFRSTLCSRGS